MEHDPFVVVRQTFEAIFAGDTEIFRQHPALTGLKHAFPKLLVAFPDFSAELKQHMVEGDRVAMHWVFSGTHEGELYGIAPTGKRVQFQNISISRVENGRIVQYNSEIGFLTVLMQLGALPLKPMRIQD
ncbi:MAG TPA: ester cyclase [Gemmatimonadaceae bacterium]|nr:ester cyclase [Gemmatimonadaceae bacterium]